MSEKIQTMDYGDKQYFIALRGIVKNKDGDNWEECEKELRESFETAKKPPNKDTQRQCTTPHGHTDTDAALNRTWKNFTNGRKKPPSPITPKAKSQTPKPSKKKSQAQSTP
jgi:hypothetical protein